MPMHAESGQFYWVHSNSTFHILYLDVKTVTPNKHHFRVRQAWPSQVKFNLQLTFFYTVLG